MDVGPALTSDQSGEKEARVDVGPDQTREWRGKGERSREEDIPILRRPTGVTLPRHSFRVTAPDRDTRGQGSHCGGRGIGDRCYN